MLTQYLHDFWVFFSFINIKQGSIYSRNNSLPRTCTDLPFTHVSPEPSGCQHTALKSCCLWVKNPTETKYFDTGLVCRLWLGNQTQVKQKSVSLEGPLMLDNGKSPGKNFSDFSFEGKIWRLPFGCGSYHVCCSHLPKRQRWQCLSSSQFPRCMGMMDEWWQLAMGDSPTI